jgi:PAS domain S-box-containing protein
LHAPELTRGASNRRTLWTGFGILLLVILLVAGYSLAVFDTIRRQAVAENREANLAQAETAARFIAEQQDAMLGLLGVIASRGSLQQTLQERQRNHLQAFLQPLLAMGTQVSSAFLIDPAGRYLERLPPAPAGQPFLPGSPLPPQPWVSGMEPGRCGADDPCVVLAVPIPAQGGKLLGHLGVTQPAAYWREFFARLSARPGRTFFLFDQADNLVAAGLDRAEFSASALTASAQEVRRRLPAEEGHWAGMTRLSNGNERAFAAAAPIPHSGWAVVVIHDYDAAMTPTRALFRSIFLFLGLLFCCLLFLGAILFTRYRAQEHRLVSLDDEARQLEALVQERTADLEVSTQRYLGLVQDLPDIVYELDQSERFTFVSRAVAGVLGYEPEKMLGCTHREFILPEDRSKYDELKAGTEHGQLMSILALRHRAADGEARWLSIHSRGIMDARGRYLGRRGVARDVTQQVLAEQQVHELSGQLIITQEEERKRLALDLHDEMGQLLSALKIGLQTLARTRAADRPDLDRLIRLTQELMDRSRSLAYRLRPAILDNFGLIAALEDLCESLSEDGVLAVEHHLDGVDDRALGPAVKTTLFRFVQEALTNVVKHAASPRAEVRLIAPGKQVRVEVRDFGRGFEVEKVLEQGGGRSLGLLGMQERLHLVGGRLSIKSSSQGTRLVAEVPLGGRA